MRQTRRTRCTRTQQKFRNLVCVDILQQLTSALCWPVVFQQFGRKYVSHRKMKPIYSIQPSTQLNIRASNRISSLSSDNQMVSSISPYFRSKPWRVTFSILFQLLRRSFYSHVTSLHFFCKEKSKGAVFFKKNISRSSAVDSNWKHSKFVANHLLSIG